MFKRFYYDGRESFNILKFTYPNCFLCLFFVLDFTSLLSILIFFVLSFTFRASHVVSLAVEVTMIAAEQHTSTPSASSSDIQPAAASVIKTEEQQDKMIDLSRSSQERSNTPF